MQSAYENQNAVTKSMMGDLMQQQQEYDLMSSQQQQQNLAAQNQAQQENYLALLQPNNNFPAKATSQTIGSLTSPLPKMQNQFQFPNTSGIQFGGT
jgi:hypothetical protein